MTAVGQLCFTNLCKLRKPSVNTVYSVQKYQVLQEVIFIRLPLRVIRYRIDLARAQQATT